MCWNAQCSCKELSFRSRVPVLESASKSESLKRVQVESSLQKFIPQVTSHQGWTWVRFHSYEIPRLFLCTISGHFLTVTSQVCSLHVISNHKCLLVCVAWAQVISVRVSVQVINVRSPTLTHICIWDQVTVLRVTCNTGVLQYFQNQTQTLLLN